MAAVQNAAAAAAAARAQQLKNDANKLAMKLPFFHGQFEEDAMEVKEFIRRFETAATSMNLVAGEEKCNMFSSYLRGQAAQVWETMSLFGNDTRNWETVKAYFLKTFQGQIESDVFVQAVTKLKQSKIENVNVFGARCLKTCYDHFISLPPPVYENLAPEIVALSDENKEKYEKEMKRTIAHHLAKTFFINGVPNEIKNALMNKLPSLITLQDAMDEASTLEKASKTRQDGFAKIHALADLDDETLEEMNLEDNLVHQINQHRSQYGRQPYKRNYNGFSRNQNGNYRQNGNQRPQNGNGNKQQRDNSGAQCWYCLKFNHLQIECKSRKNDGAPMVSFEKWKKKRDAMNKTQKKVHNAQQEDSDDSDDESITLGGVRAINIKSEPLNFH